MGLADRVAELRAGVKKRPQSVVPSERKEENPASQNKPYQVLIPQVYGDEILEHFGVKNMLMQVTRFWGEGDLYNVWCGMQLQGKERRRLVEHFEDMKLHYSPGYFSFRHPTYNSYFTGVQHPSFSYWEEVTARGVVSHRETILVQVGQLPKNNSDPDGFPHGFALGIAINVAPNGVNQLKEIKDNIDAGNHLMSAQPMENIESIELATRRLGEEKYYPPRTGSNYIDSLRKPITPWAIFTKYSDFERFEEFIAQYIVDSGFQQQGKDEKDYWADLRGEL